MTLPSGIEITTYGIFGKFGDVSKCTASVRIEFKNSM